jgi:hypothetical protein
MYDNVILTLRNIVRRKLPEKWRTKSWALLQDNAPANLLVWVKDLLATNNVTTMKHSSLLT